MRETRPDRGIPGLLGEEYGRSLSAKDTLTLLEEAREGLVDEQQGLRNRRSLARTPFDVANGARFAIVVPQVSLPVGTVGQFLTRLYSSAAVVDMMLVGFTLLLDIASRRGRFRVS